MANRKTPTQTYSGTIVWSEINKLSNNISLKLDKDPTTYAVKGNETTIIMKYYLDRVNKTRGSSHTPLLPGIFIEFEASGNTIQKVERIRYGNPESLLRLMYEGHLYKNISDLTCNQSRQSVYDIIANLCNRQITLEGISSTAIPKDLHEHPERYTVKDQITFSFVQAAKAIVDTIKFIEKAELFYLSDIRNKDPTQTVKEHHISKLALYFNGDEGVENEVDERHVFGDEEVPKKRVTYDEFLEDPYALYGRIRGIGFYIYDAIANAIKVPYNIRLHHNISHAISEIMQSEGHVYVSLSALMNQLQQASVPDISATTRAKLLEALHNDDYHKESDQEIYLERVYKEQKRVAENIARLLEGNIEPKALLTKEETDGYIDFYEKEHNNSCALHARQREAIHCFTSGRQLMTLTGGPGTGKSTIVKCMMHIAEELLGMTVATLAPTGKAAKRLPLGKTIHKVIYPYVFKDPVKGPQGPQKEDLVLIDESSMIDLKLASHLFKAYARKTRFVFIGDEDQLPPVGYGCFFKDLLNILPAANHHIRLTKTFRQSKESKILDLAKNIRKGQTPDPSIWRSVDIKCCDVRNKAQAMNLIKTITKTAYDNNEDFQILCAVKGKGDWCAQKINALIHSEVLHGIVPEIEHTRRNGRSQPMVQRITPLKDEKVIVTKNNYVMDGKKVIEARSAMNGEIGHYQKEGSKYNSIIIKRHDPGSQLDKQLVEIPDDKYDLGHAISVHKSQGSEYNKVIVIVDKAGGRLLVREMLYTSVTRAKKELIVIADPEALMKCIDTPISPRNSKLSNIVNDQYECC